MKNSPSFNLKKYTAQQADTEQQWFSAIHDRSTLKLTLHSGEVPIHITQHELPAKFGHRTCTGNDVKPLTMQEVNNYCEHELSN